MHPVFAAFVGNTSIFGVLLVLHVMGAIVGLGPTFAFGLMGNMAEKAKNPDGSIAILETLLAVETKMANPILMTVQPITGLLMIWNRGLNHDFFSGKRAWLIVSLIAYIAATIIALRVVDPALEKMISLGHAGQGNTPEFAKVAGIPKKFGPILGFLGLTLMVLMVWKPGAGCGALYRC